MRREAEGWVGIGTGREDELEAICLREFPRLVGLVALRVGDQRIAEELSQDALVRLCQKWPDVERPEAWLTRVALNLSVSWLRRRIAERRAYGRHGSATADELPPPTADRLAIREAVASLPRRQQAAVILRFYEEMSVEEAADVMGCPPGTVKSLTHRALKRLRADGGVTEQEVVERA